MADDVRVSSTGPEGGNGFSVDLREKKFGITGPNVALLLLICIIGVVAYLRTGAIDKTMKAGQEQLVSTESRVHARVDQLFERMDKLVDDIHTQQVLLTTNNAKILTGQHELQMHVDSALRAQDDRTQTQIATLLPMIADLKQYTEGWFTEMARRDDIHNYNSLNPDKALPLRGHTPEGERLPERGAR